MKLHKKSLTAGDCAAQGARQVGGRHVGIFWTLTGLLIFLWCVLGLKLLLPHALSCTRIPSSLTFFAV